MDQRGICTIQGVFRHQRERGENANGIAISVYVLVAIVKKRLGVAASLTNTTNSSLTLFEKTSLDNCLTISLYRSDSLAISNHVNLLSRVIAGQE